MPSGGSRPRTDASRRGRPKGTTGIKHASTLNKEEAREILRTRVMRDLEPMVRAQVQHAQGISHMMLRQKDGTFKRTESVDEIEAALNSGDPNSFYIYTKDPSVQAFTDLLNRALGKPIDALEVTGASQGPLVIRIEKPW